MASQAPCDTPDSMAARWEARRVKEPECWRLASTSAFAARATSVETDRHPTRGRVSLRQLREVEG